MATSRHTAVLPPPAQAGDPRAAFSIAIEREDIIVFGRLFLSTTAYSIALDRMRRRYEPDYTSVTVAGGIAIIIQAAFARSGCRHDVPACSVTKRDIMTAMAVGMLPIAAWQGIRILIRRVELAEMTRHLERRSTLYDEETTMATGSGEETESGD